MAVLTKWGYSVDSELPPIISVDDFQTATGGTMVSSEERIEAVLASVSQAIRDWCGWHVSPNLECTWKGQGEGNLMLLPCFGVTDVESLSVEGSEVSDFEWLNSGLIRIPCRFPDKWRSCDVVYRAGFDATGALAAAVVQLASNALVATPGVREEHAGQVGATYNQTEVGVSGGVRLLASDYSLLAPYRLTVR